jgi:hypothetical protein
MNALRTGPVDRETARGAYSGAKRGVQSRNPMGGRARAAEFRVAAGETNPGQSKLSAIFTPRLCVLRVCEGCRRRVECFQTTDCARSPRVMLGLRKRTKSLRMDLRVLNWPTTNQLLCRDRLEYACTGSI